MPEGEDNTQSNAAAQESKDGEKGEESKAQDEDMTVRTKNTNTTAATDTDAVIEEARRKAASLNASLLAADAEHSYMSLKKDKDDFSVRCTSQQDQISKLHGTVADLLVRLSEMERAGNLSQQKAERESRKAQGCVEKEKDANERANRMFVEADSLRKEISRLTNDKNSLNTQLSDLRASTTLSTSSATPYQFEVARLRAELDSINSHAVWLESELSTRTTQVAELKVQSSNELQVINTDLSKTMAEKDDVELELSTLRLRHDASQRKLESIQQNMLDQEQNHADVVLEKNVELNAERRLVTLSRENLARTEDRYNDAVREIETMKGLAAASAQEQSEKMHELEKRFEQQMERALKEAADDSAKKVAEVQERLQQVIVEKTQLEDEFMAGGGGGQSNRALTQGVSQTDDISQPQTLRLGYTSDTGELMTLTDLYQKLSDAEEEVRKERAERRRVELYLERVHKDIERVAPKQQQQRREYELAMSERKDMQNRLNEALSECEAVKNELQRKERQSKNFENECQELKLENGDLATQVQALLRKSLGTIHENAPDDLTSFGSINELQQQNQRLLKEHHRLSSDVSDLQKKLNTDSVHLKLREAESTLVKLEEERENQATLVASIVQQRDLYRALLVKNDAKLLVDAGEGSTAIVAAKDQIERSVDLESKNKELLQSVASLKAELSSSLNAKEGLEERLVRMDAHTEDLSLSNNKLQTELCTANAATARSVAESSFKSEKLQRLEESLESLKTELERVRESKTQSQRVNDELQSVVFQSKADASKYEEQLRQTEMKLRLVETKVQSLQAAETRLINESTSLRNDLSKHSALHESMQKIEVTLSARADEDRDRLSKEVKNLEDALASEKTNNSTTVEKMQNKLDDAEIKIQSLGEKLEKAQSDMITAKDDVNKSREELQTVQQHATTLEKTLQAAKIQLGEEDIDVSFNEKLDSLTSQLESAKEDLAAAEKSAKDYQSIAKTTEQSLLELTKVNDEYKKNVAKELEGLKSELEWAKKTATLKQDALDEISQDLSKSRTEQDKTVTDLKSSIDQLTADLEALKKDKDVLNGQVDSLNSEIVAYKADASAATNNYERELALHSSALSSLRKAREEVEKEKELRQKAESIARSIKEEWAGEKHAWEESKTKLEEADKEAKQLLEDSKKQNDILHNQLESLSNTVDKFQSDRASSLSQSGETDDSSEQQQQKLVSELREVVRFLRSERDLFETQLQTARRASQRELAKAEISAKELEAARAELEIARKRGLESNDSSDSVSDLKSKLKQAEQQLILLNESNKLLRDESEKLDQKMVSTEKQANESLAKINPLETKCRNLQINNSALEAEKKSLLREVDDWRDRVSSLVSKFHQIDPEEHAKALTKIEEGKKECAELKAAKLQAEKEATGAKAVLSRVNKDLTKFKSMAETTKKTLDKMLSEKDNMLKSNEKTSGAYKKELQELKTSKKSLESQLKNKNTEFEQQKGRVENLTKMLRNNKKIYTETQQKMQDAIQKEQDLKKQLAKEKEVNKSLQKVRDDKTERKEDQNDTSKNQKKSVAPVTIPQSSGMKSSKTSTPVAESEKTTTTKTSETETSTTVKKKLPAKNTTNQTQVPSIPGDGFKFAPSPVNDENPKSVVKTDAVPLARNTNVKGKSIVTTVDKKEATQPETKGTISTTGKDCNVSTNNQADTDMSNTGGAQIKESGSKSNLHTTMDTTPSTSKTPDPSTKNEKKENNLREKIMKKKRQLEEMKGKSGVPMPPAKRIEATSAPSSTTEPQKSEVSPIPAETEGTAKAKQPLPGTNTAESKVLNERSSSNSSMVDSTPTKEVPSKDDGLNTTGKSEEGDNLKTSMPTSNTPGQTNKSSGAFLDHLKPPGTGLSSPLVFGSSSNIQLPTPSKNPTDTVTNNPFNAFEQGKVQTNIAEAAPFGIKQQPPADLTAAASITNDKELPTIVEDNNESVDKVMKEESKE